MPKGTKKLSAWRQRYEDPNAPPPGWTRWGTPEGWAKLCTGYAQDQHDWHARLDAPPETLWSYSSTPGKELLVLGRGFQVDDPESVPEPVTFETMPAAWAWTAEVGGAPYVPVPLPAPPPLVLAPGCYRCGGPREPGTDDATPCAPRRLQIVAQAPEEKREKARLLKSMALRAANDDPVHPERAPAIVPHPTPAQP